MDPHHLRHQVPDGFTLFQRPADIGARKINLWYIKKLNIPWVGNGLYFVFRPIIDVKAVIFKEQFVVFPFGKACQVIGAHDQHKAVVGVFFLQIRQSINSIGRARQVKFDIGGL